MRDSKNPDWNIFVGCLFFGLGIGLIAGEAAGGILIGMGVGFLAMSLLPYIRG